MVAGTPSKRFDLPGFENWSNSRESNVERLGNPSAGLGASSGGINCKFSQAYDELNSAKFVLK